MLSKVINYRCIFSICNKHASLTTKIGKQRNKSLVGITPDISTFYMGRSPKRQKYSEAPVFFALLRSAPVKAAHKMLMKYVDPRSY